MQVRESQENQKLSKSLKLVKRQLLNREVNKPELKIGKQLEKKALLSESRQKLQGIIGTKLDNKSDQNLAIFSRKIGQTQKKRVSFNQSIQQDLNEYQLLTFNNKLKSINTDPLPDILKVQKRETNAQNGKFNTSY